MKSLLCLFALMACHKPNPGGASDAPIDQFTQVEERAAAMTSPLGWITCVTPEGEHDCLGDALIFSGIAMGAADCAHGQIYQDALQEMLAAGKVYRHPTLSDYSLDGVLGLLWGIDKRAAKCPDAKDSLAASLASLRVDLDPYFDVMQAEVAAHLGLQAPPSASDRGKLGAEIVAWSTAVVSKKAAAYRLHLSYLVLSVVKAPNSTALFCETVKEAKMPLLEDFCGRPGLSDWLDSFEPNAWEYRHQRAVWENPDGNGRQTAGVDYMMGYQQSLSH